MSAVLVMLWVLLCGKCPEWREGCCPWCPLLLSPISGVLMVPHRDSAHQKVLDRAPVDVPEDVGDHTKLPQEVESPFFTTVSEFRVQSKSTEECKAAHLLHLCVVG